jgi:hypothetical protein
MLIELQKGITLHPGTFNAVIAPEKVIVSAINSHADLQRFLFLFVCGNYSRLLSGICWVSTNFEIRRAFTAHQLFTILKEAGHTVVFIEHDPTMFDGAEKMIRPVAGALRDVGREALVVLYSPTPDRAFSALIRQADRVFRITGGDGWPGSRSRGARLNRGGQLHPEQMTLEVS